MKTAKEIFERAQALAREKKGISLKIRLPRQAIHDVTHFAKLTGYTAGEWVNVVCRKYADMQTEKPAGKDSEAIRIFAPPGLSAGTIRARIYAAIDYCRVHTPPVNPQPITEYFISSEW